MPTLPSATGQIIAVALCQGAALHYVNGSNGIKDLDVWTFYAERPALIQYPPRILARQLVVKAARRMWWAGYLAQRLTLSVDCLDAPRWTAHLSLVRYGTAHLRD